MPFRVFSYPAFPTSHYVTTDLKQLDRQYSLAVDFRHELVELANAFRESLAQLRNGGPGLADAYQKFQDQQSVIERVQQQHNAAAANRSLTDQIKYRLDFEEKRGQHLQGEVQKLHAKWLDSAEYKKQKKTLGDKYRENCRKAFRDTTELFWPTKDEVRTSVLKSWKDRKGKTITHKRVQTTIVSRPKAGTTANEVYDQTCLHVQIRHLKLNRYIVRFRIGSKGKGNRTPIWSELMVYMDRPIPLNARIAFVRLTRRSNYCRRSKQTGKLVFENYYTYTLQFMCEVSPTQLVGGPHKHAVLELGARLLPDQSIQFGTLAVEGKKPQPLTLPPTVWRKYQQATAIKEKRRQAFDAVRKELKPFLPALLKFVEENVSASIKQIDNWRSDKHLLAILWALNLRKGNRNAHEVISLISSWKDADDHVKHIQFDLFARASNIRSDCYRKTLRTLLLGHITLEIREAEPENKAVAAAASVSQFRSLTKQAFLSARNPNRA